MVVLICKKKITYLIFFVAIKWYDILEYKIQPNPIKWIRKTWINISKMATVVEADTKAPFSKASTPKCWGRRNSFFWVALFTFGLLLIMLDFKQGGIKHHFLSLWYDSTRDWVLYIDPRPSRQSRDAPV